MMRYLMPNSLILIKVQRYDKTWSGLIIDPVNATKLKNWRAIKMNARGGKVLLSWVNI